MQRLNFTIKYFVITYLLNFIWESLHAYFLYWGYRGVSFADYSIPEYFKLMAKVSLVDAGILTAIFLVGFLIWKDWRWGDSLIFFSSHDEPIRQAQGKLREESHVGIRQRFFTSFRMTKTSKWFYFLSATIGIAIWIEIKGVYLTAEWFYLETMPTIFGLGLSPLLQLAVTGFIAILAIKKF